jgi:VIT1/CCC1 family predicted Fe2+/Mn2+ transporter
MHRVVIFIFLFGAIPWALVTWWEMRRSQSAKERAWVARTSLSTWLGALLSAMAFVLMSMRGQFLAVPLVVALWLGVRHGLRKTRARIREQEGDPVSRAKPLN